MPFEADFVVPLRLHEYLVAAHWRDQKLLGPDPGLRLNYRVWRFVKSALPWLPWADDVCFIQAQGYWILDNWYLCELTGEERFSEIARACSDAVIGLQRPDGGWDYPVRAWKGRTATVEGIWGATGLLASFRQTGEAKYLEAALKWHAYQEEQIGYLEDGEQLAVNYFAQDRRARIPNNSALLLRLLADDLSAVIWRTGWGADDLVFGLKAGAHGGRFAFDTFVRERFPWETPCRETYCQLNIGHDHEDTNTFYVYQGGWLALENAEVERQETSYHNTLLIDGQGQYEPPSDRSWRYPTDFVGSDGFLEATASSPHFDFLAADATRRYKHIKGLNDVTRYALFIRPNYLVMFDRIEADDPHQVEWVAHFEAPPTVEDMWIRGGSQGDYLLGIGFAAPQPFAINTGNDELPYVRVSPETPAESVLFASVLYPTDRRGWDARPAFALVDRTPEGVLLRLQPHDGSQGVFDVVLAFEKPESPVEIGPYRFDGRVAVIVWGADNALEKLFIYGGTFLEDISGDGQMLIEGLGTGAPFEAIFSGEAVLASGEPAGEVTLFAPAAEQVTLNGRPRSFSRLGHTIVF